MGNNLSSGQKEDKRTLLASLSSGDAPAIAAVITANPKLLASKMDKATGNNLIHVAVISNGARPLAILLGAVSAGYANRRLPSGSETKRRKLGPTRDSSAAWDSLIGDKPPCPAQVL